MLLELHVKNLALIEQVDVEFANGLNILTGETGAGKSILMGSVNLALGQKASREMIRSGAEYAYVELVFSVEEKKQAELATLDIFPDEDGILVISRKIMATRSVSKINDETVTAAALKQVTGLLIDIHGQHEHQSLLYSSKHLEILDTYAKSKIYEIKDQIAKLYDGYQELKKEISKACGDQESRKREVDFLQFEIDEIENANLKDGEEEALTEAYRFFSNGRKIVDSLSAAYEAAKTESLDLAMRQINQVAEYDERIQGIRDQLYDVESILNDARHEIQSYLEEVTFDEEELIKTQERLDLIHGLQTKYGNTITQIMEQLGQKKARLEQLEHFDEYQAKLQEQFAHTTNRLEERSSCLSKLRRQAAEELVRQIRAALEDLNFLDVTFSMDFRRLDHYTPEGYDEAEFLISTNPGEPARALGMVASGGELSRIMLAIKTVLADSDEIPTLIFDEIDTGISGRTAQSVSEKLSIIGGSHQVICITHLPQIAAMADCHFEIAKAAENGKTTTQIFSLDESMVVKELARLLGGAQITDAVIQNAREMKELAESVKKTYHKKSAI